MLLYSLNKINTIKLTTLQLIEPYTEYIAAIKVSNVGSGVKPMGLDTGYPYEDGRQLSENGSYFINAKVDMNGNAMISMEVEKATAGYNPGMTYKVYINEVADSQMVSDNKYTKSIFGLTEPQVFTVNVAAVYPDGEKKSQYISVLVDPISISSEEAVVVNVYPNPVTSSPNIVGNVSSASLFNMIGQEVDRIENNNRMKVSSLPAGAYLLRSMIDGKIYTNKIQVVK